MGKYVSVPHITVPYGFISHAVYQSNEIRRPYEMNWEVWVRCGKVAVYWDIYPELGKHEEYVKHGTGAGFLVGHLQNTKCYDIYNKPYRPRCTACVGP